MIICATPRCGGTIFCMEEASRLGIPFAGEINPSYVRGLGGFGARKERHHETGFQPHYQMSEYISHLVNLTSPEKLYLVNAHVSIALPSSSVRIATRDLDRAFRSMADLIIRSSPDLDADAQVDLVKSFCRAQLETNVLITQFCAVTGEKLLLFEDLYVSKGQYPALERHPLLPRLNAYLGYLKLVNKMHQ